MLLETVGLDRAQEDKVVGRFTADRDEAYRELIDKCADFEAEIAKETAAEHFTYAELEENDEDLEKLKSRLAKIRRLDFYHASCWPKRPPATPIAQRCSKTTPARIRRSRGKSLHSPGAHSQESAMTAVPPGLRRAVLIVAPLNIAYFGVEFAVALAIDSVSLFAERADFLEDAAINLLIVVALG